jgi:hypothetical protein
MLISLKEIAQDLRVFRKTSWRWIQSQAFPACKTTAGMWMTFTSLADLWILARRRVALGLPPHRSESKEPVGKCAVGIITVFCHYIRPYLPHFCGRRA